jgi:PIN domain nuclease of toxin-antitoxin system
MRVLIDTHTLLWAVDQPAQLGAAALVVLQEPTNSLLLSAATIWEIAIKVGLRKLSLSVSYRQWIGKAMIDLGLSILPITVEYADVQANLVRHHGDSFDRFVVAQAMVENLAIVSIDEVFDRYGVKRIWG